MKEYGLTTKGFKRKRYIDILEDMQANAKSFFGRDINVATNSPLGIFLKVVAFSLGEIWQLAENTYYAAYKDTATGYQADYIGQYIGMKRKPATYAKGIATFTGASGTVIPSNFVIAYDDVKFWTLRSATIPSVGYIDVNIQAIDVGESGNVPAGKIAKVVSALYGVETVTNALPILGGEEVETDTEFRKRYDESISGGGSSTTESIKAALFGLELVKEVRVNENDTLVEVAGLPAKSIAVFIYGGADIDIAQTIFNTKGGGIQAYGTTVVEMADSNNVNHQIGFTRATEVPIYIKIVLTKDDDYPTDGDATINAAVVKYIGGTDADAKEHAGRGLGGGVIYTKIISLCHSVPGVTNVEVELSTDNTLFSSANINIDTDSVAKTDAGKVVIT